MSLNLGATNPFFLFGLRAFPVAGVPPREFGYLGLHFWREEIGSVRQTTKNHRPGRGIYPRSRLRCSQTRGRRAGINPSSQTVIFCCLANSFDLSGA